MRTHWKYTNKAFAHRFFFVSLDIITSVLLLFVVNIVLVLKTFVFPQYTLYYIYKSDSICDSDSFISFFPCVRLFSRFQLMPASHIYTHLFLLAFIHNTQKNRWWIDQKAYIYKAEQSYVLPTNQKFIEGRNRTLIKGMKAMCCKRWKAKSKKK